MSLIIPPKKGQVAAKSKVVLGKAVELNKQIANDVANWCEKHGIVSKKECERRFQEAGIQTQAPPKTKPSPPPKPSMENLFGFFNFEPQVVRSVKMDVKAERKILNALKIGELREMARTKGLKGYSTATKKELTKMIALHDARRKELKYKGRNCLGKKELSQDYSKRQLQKAASHLGLKGIYELRKDELCNVLHTHQNNVSQATKNTQAYLTKVYLMQEN